MNGRIDAGDNMVLTEDYEEISDREFAAHTLKEEFAGLLDKALGDARRIRKEAAKREIAETRTRNKKLSSD